MKKTRKTRKTTKIMYSLYLDRDVKIEAHKRAYKELVPLAYVMRQLLKNWLATPSNGCSWLSTDIKDVKHAK